MTPDSYVEHQILEVESFRLVDATATGSRPHDDLVWVGYGGFEGRWLTPDRALTLAAGIAVVANGNLVRRGQTLQLTDDQKAAAYYKAGMLRQAPPFIPAKVRVLCEQFGGAPFRGAGVSAGDHECTTNKWGAVSVNDRSGKLLGLRLGEFEVLVWAENPTGNKEKNEVS